MAPRTVYANLVDGYQPANLLDFSFQDVGSLGVIPCSASGTNAITITPIASLFPPTINNPPNTGQMYSFVAKATSTGLVTGKVDSATGFFNVYRMDGSTQAGSGDIVINVTYILSFNPALNSNAGGFQIVAPVTDILNPVISGATISGSTITTSTYNGNTWTAGTGTLTIAALKTLTANNSLTFTGTDGTSFAFPGTSDTVVTLGATQTLTAKTLTSPTINGATIATSTFNGNTLTTGTFTITGASAKTLTFNNSLALSGTDGTTMTFPGSSDTVVTLTASQTLTNKTLTAPVLGAATATSVTFSPTTGGIVGTTTNDNASAGTVGEYIESVIPSGSAVSLTTGVGKTWTSISLTAGDWDVEIVPTYTGGATTTVLFTQSSISLTNNSPDTTNGRAVGTFNNNQAVFGSIANLLGGSTTVRFSFSTTTTVFAVSMQTFGTSTLSVYGLLRARRVR